MDGGPVGVGRLLMAEESTRPSSGNTSIPASMSSSFQETVLRLDLGANLHGPQALFSPPG